jgi:hypothetical protein
LPIEIQVVGKYWIEAELIVFGKQVASSACGFIIPNDYI